MVEDVLLQGGASSCRQTSVLFHCKSFSFCFVVVIVFYKLAFIAELASLRRRASVEAGGKKTVSKK